MPLSSAFVLLLLSQLLLSCFLLPRVERLPKPHSIQARLKRAAIIAVLEFIKSSAFCGALGTGAVLATVACLNVASGLRTSDVETWLACARTLKGALAAISGGIGYLVSCMAALGLFVFYHRTRRASEMRVVDSYMPIVNAWLEAALEGQQYKDYGPSPTMNEILKESESLKTACLAAIEGGATDPDVTTRLVAETTGKIEALYQVWRHLAVERLLELCVPPPGEEPLPRRSKVSSILNVILSESAFKTLKWQKKILGLACMVLLLPGFIQVQSSPLEEAAQNAVYKLEKTAHAHRLELENLRLQTAGRQAQEQWETFAKEQSSGDSEENQADESLSQEDEDTIANIATLFEQNAGEGRFVGFRLPDLDTSFFAPVREATARENVLRNCLAAAPHEVMERTEITPSAVRDGTPLQRAMADQLFAKRPAGSSSATTITEPVAVPDVPVPATQVKPRGAEGPKTALGGRVQRDLRKQWVQLPKQTRVGVVKKVQTFIDGLHKPVSSDVVASEIFSAFLGKIIEATAPLPQGADPVSKIAASLMKTGIAAPMQEAYRIAELNLVKGLVQEPTVEAAVARLETQSDLDALNLLETQKRITEALTDTTRSLFQKVSPRQKRSVDTPSLATKPEAGVDMGKVQRIIEELRPKTPYYSSGLAEAYSVTESVAEYADYFPGVRGADLQTSRGRMIAAWLPEVTQEAVQVLSAGTGAPSIADSVTDAARIAAQSINRLGTARSVRLLRGFSRVGGVLIGQESANPSETYPVVVDFSWDVQGDSAALQLMLQDETLVSLEPMPKRVINQALAYAADGRVLAATMVTAPPLEDLKILVHPALVDTPLGCAVIEVDRFVDKYTSSLPFRQAAYVEVQAQVALYKAARARRLKVFLDALTGDADNRPDIERRKQELLTDIEVPEVFKAKAEELLAAKRLPLLQAKPEFFDKELVGWILTSTGQPCDLDQVLSQVSEKALASLRTLDEEGRKRWFAEGPEYQIWSGVRETPFNRNSSFDFVRQKKDALLDPLEFVLQVAFTCEPAFYEGDASLFNDEKPFEFAELKKDIEEAITKGLSDPGNADDRNALKLVQQFTFAQRLFRNLFSGSLGKNAPIEKLAALASATGDPDACYLPTPRWNANPGAIEQGFLLNLVLLQAYLEKQKDVDGKAGDLQRIAAKLKGCLEKWVEKQHIDLGNDRTLDKILEREEGRENLSRNARSVLTLLKTWIDRTRTTLELRVALQVSKDEKAKHQCSCGATE